MPAQISSILDGPAGPPPPRPDIEKPGLRRLADAIASLPDTRLAVLTDLLVAAGIPERDATLNLDLEALPVRVYRKVWACVFDPAPASEPPIAARRNVVIADVRDGSDSPLPKLQHPPVKQERENDLRKAGSSTASPRRSSFKPDPDNEDDELRDDDELVPGLSASTPIPTKRKPSSSRAGKQKRRASSASSRSDASGDTQGAFRFIETAPHPQAGPSGSSIPVQPLTSPAAGGSKLQWTAQRPVGLPCDYESPIPGFPACTRTFSRAADRRRHIDHQHFEEEAQAVIDGRIDRKQAKLLGDDWKGQISKPTCEGCGQTFSRKDAVKRHQTETGAKVIDGVCVSCPGSGNGSGAGKKRARRK